MAIQQFTLGTCDLISVVTATTTNLNISTLFGDNYARPFNKTVVIESGVTIGSNSVGSAALVVPSGGSGLIKVINKGSIQGAGGAGGTSGVGGNGGDAVLLQAAAVVVNDYGGFIYAGGGGGGKGGVGGQGGSGQTVTPLGQSNCYQPKSQPANYYCVQNFGGAAYCSPGTYSENGCAFSARCSYCSKTDTTAGGLGGAGGNGGRGRGYDGSLASGSAGSAGAAGSIDAGAGGAGGTGGAGGDWGASGSTGDTGLTGANGTYSNGLAGFGGSGGGLAGFYINGLSTYASFINFGTVAGRTN